MTAINLDGLRYSGGCSGNDYAVSLWTNERTDWREPVTRALVIARDHIGLCWHREFTGPHAYGMANAYQEAAVDTCRRTRATIYGPPAPSSFIHI